MKIYGGMHPFKRFPLGWREAIVDIRPRTVYIRVDGKAAVVKMKRDKFEQLIEEGVIKNG